MASAADTEEITHLRAALRDAELRLQEKEQAWIALDKQRLFSERIFSVAFNEGLEAIGLAR